MNRSSARVAVCALVLTTLSSQAAEVSSSHGTTWSTESSGAGWAVSQRADARDDLRFEVRPGDKANWDLSHGHAAERAEISDAARKEPLDRDIWFSMGLMVEPGPKVTSRWMVLGQLRPTEDPGDAAPSPAWAQELAAGDEFKVLIRSSQQKPVRSSPAPVTLFSDRSFERGRVYRLVYDLRYSAIAGRLRVWRDGRQIVNYEGPLGYVGRQGPFFKFGIYRDPAPETVVVHYLDLRFGGPELKPG